MTRRMAGTVLLAVGAAVAIGAVILLLEACGSSTLNINDRRDLARAAEVCVVASALVAFCGLRLVWKRAGWSGWLISIGLGLAVGLLTAGAALLGGLSGDCRYDP